MDRISTQERRAAESHLGKNLFILAFSVGTAIVLAENEAFRELIAGTSSSRIIGSFVGGLFFTSLFTAGPATVVLAEIMQGNGILVTALIGGAGAVLGDLVLFEYLKTHVTDELERLFACPTRGGRLCAILHLRIVRWLMTFLGALIIASPLPDEIGLMLMGIGKLRPRYLMAISYLLNTAGIIALGLVARQII